MFGRAPYTLQTRMSNTTSSSIPLRLCEAIHPGRYRVLSVQTERGVQDSLASRGIEQGGVVEVMYNNRQGTVLVEIGRMAVILGRTCSFRIQLLPLAKPAAAEAERVELPEPIPLREATVGQGMS